MYPDEKRFWRGYRLAMEQVRQRSRELRGTTDRLSAMEARAWEPN